MLSKTEKELLKIATDHINEVSSIQQMNGFRKKKQVKSKTTNKSLKKLKKDGTMKKANAIHVFQELIGAIKLGIISYLRLDIFSKDIQDLVYGLSKIETERFMAEIRLMLCHDVANHYKHRDLFIRPIEVHKWLYKSSYTTRSVKISKELSELNGIALASDILNLKNYYLSKGRQEATSEENAIKIWETWDSSDKEKLEQESTQDTFDFLVSMLTFESSIRIVLRDIEDQNLLDKNLIKRCKYINTQVKTLCNTIENYIKETEKDIQKNTEDKIKYNEIIEYRKKFGKYEKILQVTCNSEGINFCKENEYIFYGYYEELLGFNSKRLAEEKEWLGVA